MKSDDGWMARLWVAATANERFYQGFCFDWGLLANDREGLVFLLNRECDLHGCAPVMHHCLDS